MDEKKIQNNSDTIGMISSALCLVHCIATPLIIGWYSIQEEVHHHAGHNHSHASMGGFNWDYFFILLAFVAVYFSNRNHHATPLIKQLLWGFFALFAIGIGLEAYHVVFQYMGYTASLGLIGTHWYNYRLCQTSNHSVA